MLKNLQDRRDVIRSVQQSLQLRRETVKSNNLFTAQMMKADKIEKEVQLMESNLKKARSLSKQETR